MRVRQAQLVTDQTGCLDSLCSFLVSPFPLLLFTKMERAYAIWKIVGTQTPE